MIIKKSIQVKHLVQGHFYGVVAVKLGWFKAHESNESNHLAVNEISGVNKDFSLSFLTILTTEATAFGCQRVGRCHCQNG